MIFFGQKIVIAKQLGSLLRATELYHLNDGRKRDKIVAEMRAGSWLALWKRGPIPSRAKRGGIPGVLRSEQGYPPLDWRGLHSRIAQFSLRRVAAFPKPNRIVEASAAVDPAGTKRSCRQSGSPLSARPPCIEIDGALAAAPIRRARMLRELVGDPEFRRRDQDLAGGKPASQPVQYFHRRFVTGRCFSINRILPRDRPGNSQSGQLVSRARSRHIVHDRKSGRRNTRVEFL